MTRLDQIWLQMLAEAGAKADKQGRIHVGEYLRLRVTNDLIRMRGVEWLLNAFVEAATATQRQIPSLYIERLEPHSFRHGSSTMVGTRLSVRHGVRCLTVEAGWARIPSHGIMPGGALAIADILHFGIPKANSSLRLVHRADELPCWIDEKDIHVELDFVQSHLDTLLEV